MDFQEGELTDFQEEGRPAGEIRGGQQQVELANYTSADRGRLYDSD
jgi:hypothetical protein